LLLEAIASCAAADVVDILRKGRQEIEALKRLDLKFKIRGPVDETKARRAVDLSLEKYCSVFHSLRMDISLDTSVVVHP